MLSVDPVFVSMAMLCDLPVRALAAGDKDLLQSSRNASGLQASSFAHLNCNLRLMKGERHLLLGKNGCGKTTLLRSLAARKLPGLCDSISIVHVEQDSPAIGEFTPLDVVLAMDKQRQALQKKASDVEEKCNSGELDEAAMEDAVARLCEIYEELDAEDEDDRSKKALGMLKGLGFRDDMVSIPLSKLSGGWRMRATLASALFMSPDLLLLDEPTNHLDLPAIIWLQNHLLHHFTGTLLCVSHDRVFINEIATQIIIFADHSLEYCRGNLDDFEKEATRMTKNMDRQSAALEKKKDHIMDSIKAMELAKDKRSENQSGNKDNNRYGPFQGGGRSNGGKASKQVTQRIKKLERIGLERTLDGRRYHAHEQEGPRIGAACNNDGGWVDGKMTAVPIVQRADPTFQLEFQAATPLGLRKDIPILELRDVGFSYSESGEVAVQDVDLSVGERCRIAVVGKNGSGKSTILKLITGDIQPTSGEVRRHHHLRIAFFGQHQAELLQFCSETPLEYMQKLVPKMKEQDCCSLLNEFKFDNGLALQPIDTLSGGQRMRLTLARMCAEEQHLLILDEPTNNLDIYSIEALIDALKRFQGGVIFVTHNRSMLLELASEIVVIRDSRILLREVVPQGACRPELLPQSPLRDLLLGIDSPQERAQHTG